MWMVLIFAFSSVAQAECELLSRKAQNAFVYCAQGTTPEVVAKMVNETKDKYRTNGFANYYFYSDKKKAPRSHKDLDKLNEKTWKKIEFGYANYNWHNKFKELKLKHLNEENLHHHNELLKW